MSFFKSALFVSILSFTIQGRAFISANLSGQWNAQKPLRLLVVGYANGTGAEFLESAIATAYRYQEAFPEQQILILKNNETGTIKDVEQIKAYGLKVLSSNTKNLTGVDVVSRALKSNSIVSIEFFAHSAISEGAALQDDATRFNSKTPRLTELLGHFAQDAYVFFHGCNGGFFEAPTLSKILKVPVIGAMTSANFRRLRNGGDFVPNDPEAYDPATFAKANALSFVDSISCKKGACLRLQPENTPYNGEWGHFDGGGLSFFKTFCNNGISEDECSRIMAYSLIGQVSLKPLTLQSSAEDFQTVAADVLCPADEPVGLRGTCMEKLASSLDEGQSEEYSPFRGNALECTFRDCNVSWKCKSDPSGNPIHGTCQVIAPKNAHPKALIQEFKRYVRGIELLQNH
jgi:hypothetical protein